jgi:hypothetical protein
MAALYEKVAENYGEEDVLIRPDVKRIWRKKGKCHAMKGLRKERNGAGKKHPARYLR